MSEELNKPIPSIEDVLKTVSPPMDIGSLIAKSQVMLGEAKESNSTGVPIADQRVDSMGTE